MGVHTRSVVFRWMGLSSVLYAVYGVWDAPGVVRAAGGHLIFDWQCLRRASAWPFLASPLYVLLAT